MPGCPSWVLALHVLEEALARRGRLAGWHVGAVVLALSATLELRNGTRRGHHRDGMTVAILCADQEGVRDHLDVGESRARQTLLDELLNRLRCILQRIALLWSGMRSDGVTLGCVLREGRDDPGQREQC